MKHLNINLFLTFSISLFFSSTIFSQGLLWDDEIKQKTISSFEEVDISKTRSYLPYSASLEKYLPDFIYHQGNTAMCVAVSLSNCRTIIYNRNKRILNKTKILANSFSPFSIYYNLKTSTDYNCTMGLFPYEVLESLWKNGVAKLIDVEYPEYYPFTDKQLCSYYPPSYSSDISDAYSYRIDEPKILNDDL